MKKFKKLIVMITMLALGSGLALTGCGKDEVAPPKTAAKAFYDLYVLTDSTEIIKLGLTEDEAKTILDAQRNAVKQATKKNFTTAGLSIDDAKLNEIVDAQFAALKKLSAEIEEVSVNGDTAEVKITTKYVDIAGADQKACDDAEAQVLALNLTSQSEALKKFAEIYSQNIIDNFKAVDPSTDTKNETYTFKKMTYNVGGKNKDIWAPQDANAFGASLGKLIIK